VNCCCFFSFKKQPLFNYFHKNHFTAGPNFYNDLHMFSMDKLTWSDVKRKKVYPSARAGHSGVAIGTNMFIFGGMTRDGALDETWKLDTSGILVFHFFNYFIDHLVQVKLKSLYFYIFDYNMYVL